MKKTTHLLNSFKLFKITPTQINIQPFFLINFSKTNNINNKPPPSIHKHPLRKSLMPLLTFRKLCSFECVGKINKRNFLYPFISVQCFSSACRCALDWLWWIKLWSCIKLKICRLSYFRQIQKHLHRENFFTCNVFTVFSRHHHHRDLRPKSKKKTKTHSWYIYLFILYVG